MKFILPSSVAALTKTLVYGRSLSGVVGWNLPGSMDFLSLVSVVRCQVEVSAMDLSLVQRSPTECSVCLSVIEEGHEGGIGPLGLSSNN